MKESTRYRIVSVGFFMTASLTAAAQNGATIELDTLQKVIGILMVAGGVFMGYMTMRLAHKLAEQELKFNIKLDDLEEKLTLKFENNIKEVQRTMATHHDINGLKQIMVLQHENVKEAQDNIKERLKEAASIYKKDKE